MSTNLLYSLLALMTLCEKTSKRVLRNYLSIVTAALFVITVASLIIFFPHHQAQADNLTYVTVYDNGSNQTFATHAKTVGDLLNEVHIPVGKYDLVEPSEDTVLLGADYNVNIYTARPVEVIDGTNKYTVMTAAQTPQDIVAAAGLSLYPQDTTSTNLINNFVEAGNAGVQVTINRATPFTFDLYGNPVPVRTQAKTVGEFLASQNITMKQGDQLMTPVDTPISTGMTVNLVHNGSEVVTTQQTIPFAIQTVADVNEPAGYSNITQQGKNGQQVVTYEITTQNGQEVSRQVLNTVVETPAVPEVVHEGVGDVSADQVQLMADAGISASDYSAASYIITHESGWCPTKWQGEYGGCPAYHGTPTSYIGYGLCQSTPAWKMASAGSDWATNPVTQLEWCTSYANSAYGGWQAAASHWAADHSW
ncbi:MAG TPA: ubiquitin-like domain-containing protein [Candidatus Saccharimonadales bacterium]|nr:ubiquitin-like domain-containing protein [Candidatus Saccharimonadales bacterium]